jgi:lipopolysaccharide export LptBFGC system permease protein LptF
MHQIKKDLIAFGVLFVIFSIATVIQVILWKSGIRAWIIFRLYFLPIPLVLVTGVLALISLYSFLREMAKK